jgi:WD40 repeat protein
MRILQGHAGPVRCVAYSRDGKVLASAGDDRAIKLWDVESGHARATLDGHTDWVRAVAFSPDSKHLASAGWDAKVRLWRLSRKNEQNHFDGHEGGAWSLAYSPDGTLASGAGDGIVRIYLAPSRDNPLTLSGHEGR